MELESPDFNNGPRNSRMSTTARTAQGTRAVRSLFAECQHGEMTCLWTVAAESRRRTIDSEQPCPTHQNGSQWYQPRPLSRIATAQPGQDRHTPFSGRAAARGSADSSQKSAGSRTDGDFLSLPRSGYRLPPRPLLESLAAAPGQRRKRNKRDDRAATATTPKSCGIQGGRTIPRVCSRS